MNPERKNTDREVEGAIEAVDIMIDVVDGLEEYVIISADTETHGTRYRLNLLWIHAIAAVTMAPLLMYTGKDGLNGPSLSFIADLPGSPLSIALMLWVGGLILGMGAVFRAKRTEMVGLCFLATFYILFAVSLAVPPIRWLAGDGGMKPAFYAPILYGHMATIMAVHIWGLVMRRRDDARIRRLSKRGE